MAPGREAQPRDAGSSSEHVGSRFGGHFETVLAQPARIEPRDDGALVISRADGSFTTGAALAIARDVHEGVEIDFGNGALVRIREDGALGSPVHAGHAATYRRRGGRSHWTVASEHTLGFEEWLEIEPGLAYADRILASWQVVGASLREVVETGGVHVLGSDGELIAYVSAPRAWSLAGDELTPRLSVESERIVLRVDGGGAAVLVDPLWVPTGMLSEARCFYPDGMVAVPDGALVAGSSNCSTVMPRGTTERYSTVTGVWSMETAMSRPRASHSTTVLADGRVLVAGGHDGTSFYLASAEIYDPATGTWTTTGSMAAPRLLHASVLLHDGRVLVAGGWDGAVLATAEIYDPVSGTWSAAGPMISARMRHRAVTLLDGSVLVTGSRDVFHDEVYDPATGAWRSTGGGRGLIDHTLTLLRDGRVLLSGGSYATSSSYQAQLWDPVTEAWSWTGPMSIRRYQHTATLLPSGRVLVAGGLTRASAAPLAASEIYDPTFGTFSGSEWMYVGRAAHAAVLLERRSVLGEGRIVKRSRSLTNSPSPAAR